MSEESRLLEFQSKWVGRVFQCNETGEKVTIPYGVKECNFFTVGNGYIDVGRLNAYARFSGVTEVKGGRSFMMSLAEFLLNSTHEHNGHKQTEVKGLSIEDGQTLCRELSELTQHESVFVIELWTNGDYTIYQKDYFDVGHVGGVDRMILSVINT